MLFVFHLKEMKREKKYFCLCYFLQLKSEVIYNENYKNWGFEIWFLFVCWSKGNYNLMQIWYYTKHQGEENELSLMFRKQTVTPQITSINNLCVCCCCCFFFHSKASPLPSELGIAGKNTNQVFYLGCFHYDLNTSTISYLFQGTLHPIERRKGCSGKTMPRWRKK